ncbi:MAG: hypothetical protein EP344_05255 [Bacteroidetes bacterium]|nr:MAG: hypothetical protein EP344_05255 [Bacteroidota bacterium]
MGKPKVTWTISRTALFVVIGLLNTVFVRPEDIGSWKNYAGYGFLLLALVDAVVLVREYIRSRSAQ